MARGDCENAFQAAAAADGIVLVRARVPWINQRGHLGLPEQAAPVLPVLDEIFKTLGGIEPEQAAKKATVLPGDFLHVESGVFIETDEEQRFTSHRLVTLSLYPNDVPLGFDLDGYKRLCETRAHRADRYRVRPGRPPASACLQRRTPRSRDTTDGAPAAHPGPCARSRRRCRVRRGARPAPSRRRPMTQLLLVRSSHSAGARPATLGRPPSRRTEHPVDLPICRSRERKGGRSCRRRRGDQFIGQTTPRAG